MGWTCQHDYKGFCKLLNVVCTPGIKGCTLNKGKHDYFFTSGNFEEDKKREESKKRDSIDFAALARSN
ncbi:hypothetical protein [Sulfurimonas paralvinellae]|uniref:Uncharacterized protein n=1 Tax=Sulfurimonas paralvinellae TaxID=317658 RepID=A0A7M1B7Z5_9BACT|nr:hypothetical protein [Sulfurimonas paralvinellae]QOP44898.1 hypothetical protein FM071_00730 [Sulfurimonas paralvinellae]